MRSKNMSKIEKYITALTELGDGRYHYYDSKANGIEIVFSKNPLSINRPSFPFTDNIPDICE